MAEPAKTVVEALAPAPAFPYVPNIAQLPSDRSVIFDSATLGSCEFRENTRLEFDRNFMAHWVSPSLSPGNEDTTLRTLGFQYSAEKDTFFEVDVSGDGGNNWPETRRYDVTATDKQIRRIRLAFNVTGYDLRFRIKFPTEDVIKIYSYYPSLVKRGRIVL